MEKSIKSRNPTGKEIMKRTKWFDGSKFIPAHVGVYERYYFFGIEKCYFNGSVFFVYGSLHNCMPISMNQDLPWRGLKDQNNKP